MTTAEALSATLAPERQRRLSGKLGVGSIVFMVVAAAAPLTAIGGAFPLMALLGDGQGAPAMFIVCGVVLLFFAVGLSAMSKYVAKPGAFFTYVGYGLGRPAGLSAAWVAMLTYTAIQVAVYGYLGYVLNGWMADKIDVHLAWWVWALIVAVVIAALGYRHVELSAKVLGVLLICEVGIVLVLSAVILAKGGATGVNVDSFKPSVVTSGTPALGLLFAMTCFIGFESTAIFRDEAKEPEKTIPKATYTAVIVIAAFYTFTSWALVQGWGSGFNDEMGNDYANFIMTTTGKYLGSAGLQIVNVLLMTSLFACLLSFHNVITRYQHSMANAGLLPSRIGKVHDEHDSPHVSSLLQSVTAIVLVALFAVLKLDPYLKVFTWFGGVSTFAIVVLMAVTCLAVIVYFRRNRTDAGLWRGLIAPGIGLLGLAGVFWVIVRNFPVLLNDLDANGAPRFGTLTISFLVGMAIFPVIGFVQAAVMKRTRPEAYANVIDTISE